MDTDNPLPPGTSDDPDDRKTAPFDPFIKNAAHERYHHHHRTRRSSHHNRERRRHSRSRSSSHERYRSRRKRKSSSRRSRRSRTASRSPSRDRKPTKRSRSKSRTHHGRSARRNRSKSRDNEQHKTREQPAEEEEEEEQEAPKENAFKNDGSFMAMFKRMQEEKERETQATAAHADGGERVFTGIGKRRGGRILKTGIVAKPKVEEDNAADDPQDAWSIYLKEVKRYKEACCDDDSKTRPLVK